MKKKTITFSILLILVLSLMYYYKYYYKYNQVYKFKNNNQEIYMLGTYHNMHLKRYFNYSLEDIVNCIKNINPDVVFIESREETFLKYGVIDGPIDMMLAVTYSTQNSIDVNFIDWWEINDLFKANTTDKTRDDKIYSNVKNKLSMYGDERILIICGDTHFHELSKRFLNDGYKKLKIDNKKDIFKSKDEFYYPVKMQEVIQNKITYVKTILKHEINNISSEKNKQELLEKVDLMISNLESQLDLVKNNQKYY